MKGEVNFWHVLIFIAVAGMTYLAAPLIFRLWEDTSCTPQKEEETPTTYKEEVQESHHEAEDIEPIPVEKDDDPVEEEIPEPEPPTYKEIVEKVIKEAKHSSYYFKEPKTFEIIDLEEEHIGFHFTCFIHGKDLFISSRETILQRIFLFYKTIFASQKCDFVYGASLYFYVKVMDDYGNVEKRKVANAILYRRTADKIRWENLDMANNGERLVLCHD